MHISPTGCALTLGFGTYGYPEQRPSDFLEHYIIAKSRLAAYVQLNASWSSVLCYVR